MFYRFKDVPARLGVCRIVSRRLACIFHPCIFHACIGFLSIVVTPSVASANGAFIEQRALDPYKLQTGLPEAANRSNSKHELQLELIGANVFMGGVAGDQRLLLDGESSQINLRYRHQLNACWQFNANGSWLDHSPGQFDELVSGWHNLFGLPDAMRDEWPTNILIYEVERDSVVQALPGSFAGIGDAQLQVQRYLGCTPASPIFRFGLKLPLGDAATFSGSGATDAFIDIQSAWYRSKRFPVLQWAASVGLLGSGSGELLINQEPIAGFGVMGLNVALSANSQLVTQLDWHTPLFESSLTELGQVGAQVTLGYRYNTAKFGQLELSFSEDIAIDTAPDIAVRMAWRYGFSQ